MIAIVQSSGWVADLLIIYHYYKKQYPNPNALKYQT